MKPFKPITAWSYSRLALYEECPRKFKYLNIDKMKDEKGPELQRGIKIHDQAAKFLSGETDLFPTSCASFKEEFEELRNLQPIVEEKWAFTKQMRQTTWMNKACYLRVTLDVALVYRDGWGEVIDHKTGKFYEESAEPGGQYRDQLDLFAASMVYKFPKQVTRGITARLWFLDADEEFVHDYTVDEALDAFDKLEVRAKAMMSATRFPPRPSWKCGGVRKDGTTWGCPFRKSNGGPCEFG